MDKPIVRRLRTGESDAYIRFAEKAWGRDSPQSNREHLAWLEANPNSSGQEIVVAALGNSIVGAVHRMYLPWFVAGERMAGATLHDLFLLPEGRIGSTALNMIAEVIGGERFVLLAGNSKPAEKIYKIAYRAREVACCWQQKVFNTVKAAFCHGAYRLFPSVIRSVRLISPSSIESNGLTMEWTASPSDQELEEALQVKRAGDLWVDWDMRSFRWRYFHPQGPKNILVLARDSGNVVGRAVLSRGARKGVPICRLIDLLAPSTSVSKILVEVIDRLVPQAGAAMGFSATTNSITSEILAAAGWKTRPEAPGLRIITRPKDMEITDPSIWGGAWDFGADR